MDPRDPDNRPPQPPSIPPAPPPAAMLKPNIPHVPLTPMMDFMSRRLESLEKDLAVERERANAAASLLQQQETLRSQVEDQLKGMSENLRREKAERDGAENQQHSRGRIDALEKRLDEMHQSWVTLLRDAMTQRETTHHEVTGSQETIAREQAALKQEMTALQGSINQLVEQMGQWRTETRPLADAAPALRNFEGQVGQMLNHFAVELRDRVAAWERRQSSEMEKHEDRMRDFSREKAALQRELEERDHLNRQEAIKEKLHRETQVSEQLSELSKRFTETREDARQMRLAFGQLYEKAMQNPQAKDAVIQGLESEKAELVRALRERADSFQAHSKERREVERSMGESLLQLNKELDAANARAQSFAAQLAMGQLERARLGDELAAAKRLAEEASERRLTHETERDTLVKALSVESGHTQAQIDERTKSEEAWAKRLTELQARLAAEADARVRDGSMVGDLRAQLATLSEQLAHAIQDRDAAAGRTGNWEQDRAQLIKRLQDKDATIASLSATFQRLVKDQK
jgi:hypothetical protein